LICCLRQKPEANALGFFVAEAQVTEILACV